MKKLFLILLCLSYLGRNQSFSQCDDYPYYLGITGFACNGEGSICFTTFPDDWGNCYDTYSDYAIQISYPTPNFIYTNLGNANDYHFDDISDPINNPGITTLQYYQPNPPQDGSMNACLEGAIQIDNTVFTLSIVNTQPPFDVLTTTTFTLDDIVSIGIPNQTTLLTDWIIPNGPLLPPAQAAVQGQRVEFNGTIIVNVPNYTFSTSPGSQFNEIVMAPGARIEIPNGNTLDIRGTTMHSCSSHWDRINVQGGGTFDSRISTISDADVAVELQDGATINIGFGTNYDKNDVAIASYGIQPKNVTFNLFTNSFNFAYIRNGIEGIHLEHVEPVDLINPIGIYNMSEAGIYLDNTDLNAQYIIVNDCKVGVVVPTQNNMLAMDGCSYNYCITGVLTNGTHEMELSNGHFLDVPQAVSFTDVLGNSYARIHDNIMTGCKGCIFALTAPSKAEIQYNNIRSVNRNVSVYGLGTGDHRWAIQYNPQLRVTGIASSNVLLNNTNSARIFRNDEEVFSSDKNFVINGGSNNKIGYNLLDATRENLTLLGSPMANLYCNVAAGSTQGLVVLNDNAGSRVHTNDFTNNGLNLTYGTADNVFAHTGVQHLRGNLFDLSWFLNKKARNWSANSIAAQNLYKVGFFQSQGNEYFPYFTANIPDWFDNAEVGDSVCVAPPNNAPEEGPATADALRRAAHSSIDLLDAGLGSLYGSEVEFDAKLKLYRQLTRLQALEPFNDVVLAAWYSSFNGSTVQQFVQFEELMRNVQALSGSEEATLSSLTGEISSLKSELNAIEWFSMGSALGEVSIDPTNKALRDAKAASLWDKVAERTAIVSAKRQAVLGQLGNLAAINNGIANLATNSEQNLKAANGYLLARMSPSFTGFSEPQLLALEAIADQCVGLGGEGVLLARGLVAEANSDEADYQDECIQELEEREGNSAIVARGEHLHVMPIPASEILQIMVPEELRGQSLNIVNAYGQMLGIVQTGQHQVIASLDVSGYAPGIYFIKANSGSQATVKFVVTH